MTEAIVCKELGGEDLLVHEDFELPKELGPTQIRIKVEAAALNFPDTLIIRGKYQMKPDLPFVPGHECSGTVIELGNEVPELQVGDRVLALVGNGAFAKEVVATPPFQHVYKIPDSMSFEEAAGFDLTYGTAIHGLRARGDLQVGETVLVLGASGGCGSAAVQVAKAMGATVIAAAGGEEKCQLAKELGADHVIDYRAVESISKEVKALTDGRGVEVLFDTVGGSDIREYLRCMAWNGRYLVIGFAAGDIPQIGLNLTLLKSISIVGVAYGASAIADPAGNKADFNSLAGWYEEGLLRPHVGTKFKLAEVPEALKMLTSRKAMGKIVVEIGSD